MGGTTPERASSERGADTADTADTAGDAGGDALREQLLDAAARVFARQGYEGTRIMDIVREAGLSTGAVYGRFRSKNDLLREAVISRTARVARLSDDMARVADLVTRGAMFRPEPLADAEAVRLEAYVAARREPEVAQALAEAHDRWRVAVQPLVDAALLDGTVADGVDPEAVLFFVRTMQLGLLLQRAAGVDGPDPDSWEALVGRIVASFGTPDTDTANTSPANNSNMPPKGKKGETR
ncbi:MAG TPA: TetR/AcrR family transcriptional regulator [Acidimicrobiales bacterium]|nr:TetR/AcrR family transcriptional regulator [Acidimicrobiales bacterium]